ncbi:MarR family winged helix-turn-helix transcriptional regulator [Cobetia crustatorum]|uniref:MarR family transcriptional regulator n=1 Tax=Cobetia crustatorum TaxID=553385 RepID=A0A558HND1_9GAMM|nr:MarR family transcriptional regulator [Cobetia crustatorum]TVU70607.1 MarR family transcriptional regulator [Cobetia crustatorum]
MQENSAVVDFEPRPDKSCPEELHLHETIKPSLGGLVGRVHRVWRTAITIAVQPLGMTEARWTVMVHLDKLGEGCTQQMLASELGIEMPSLTRTLNQLEAQQLIRRGAHATDKRARCLWFTAAGRDCLQQVAERISRVRSELYVGFDDADLNQFAEMLLTLEANASVSIHRSQADRHASPGDEGNMA